MAPISDKHLSPGITSQRANRPPATSVVIQATNQQLIMKDPANIDNVYEILSQIGRGSYASVHKAINRHTGEICAIKRIPKDSDIQNLISEIGILSKCKSKNIVRFMAADSTSNKHEVLIVMEYCCGGSVKDAMRQLGRTMNVEQITVILRDVLNGLEYLHANKQIHRDVKAANILLNEDGIAKLGDFGVSEMLETSAKKPSIIGTLLWLPPEVINKDQNYSTAIDLWSLGVTVIEMADGQPPFSELTQSAALDEIKNLDKPASTFKDPSKWPQNLVDFVGLCLEKDASKRKCAHELLKCDLIREAPSNDVIKRLVAEVCTSTTNQTEVGLFSRYKSLLKENIRLCSIYEERRIKVHETTVSHTALLKEFQDLVEGSKLRNKQINKIGSELERLTSEIQKLEREETAQSSCLNASRDRKKSLLEHLNVIKQKRNDEAQRRSKLEALESKK